MSSLFARRHFFAEKYLEFIRSKATTIVILLPKLAVVADRNTNKNSLLRRALVRTKKNVVYQKALNFNSTQTLPEIRKKVAFLSNLTQLACQKIIGSGWVFGSASPA